MTDSGSISLIHAKRPCSVGVAPDASRITPPTKVVRARAWGTIPGTQRRGEPAGPREVLPAFQSTWCAARRPDPNNERDEVVDQAVRHQRAQYRCARCERPQHEEDHRLEHTEARRDVARHTEDLREEEHCEEADEGHPRQGWKQHVEHAGGQCPVHRRQGRAAPPTAREAASQAPNSAT